ncbi:hypothetical protein HA402_014725 [Bradysia odoriphaga]|nr:hypothetical protein HA402_014725 [Bradysia odoriphaga]
MTITKDDRPPIGFNLTDFNSTTQLTEKPNEKQFYTSDDEYNPFEHRQVEKPNSTSGSLIHLLKSSLGTGILAMPMAFKNSGLLFGAIGTIVVGFLCTLCVHMLVKTSHDICKKAKIPSLGFSETAEEVFRHGPPALRGWSKFAREFCDYGLLLTYYGANCVYIVFISTTIHDIINYRLGLDWDIRAYIAICTIPILAIGQIRKLKYLVPFSALANIFIVVTFAITLYYMFNEPLNFSERKLFSSWGQLPYFFSTVIFAMEGIGVVMPVENDMKKPQHFLGCPGVLNTAMITVVVLYAVIGFFGYVRFGDEVKGSVTLNLPENDIIATVAQVLIAIAILFTFGLQYYVPSDIFWRKIQHRVRKERHNVTQIVIRAGFILILAALAAAVPDLEPFIGLVGAVFFSILGLFVPSVVETVFLWPDRLGFLRWKLWKNLFLIAFSLIALVSGTVVSVADIVKIYSGESEH